MKTKDMTLTALMIALLVICSQLSIPIQPVPITLQTLAVLLIGYLLSPKNAFLTGLCYLIMGIIGLPVFAGFSGGYQSFLSPSFGFVISFMFAAGLGALYLTKVKHRSYKQLLLAGLIMSVVIYSIGLPYMWLILNQVNGVTLSLTELLAAGLLPFIPGGIIKIIFGMLLAKQLSPVFVTNK
ncbi:biotin transporter BioY [Aerococcaceae bacterium DSM 111020]|nr:biotin transporter BioY [Aerococcaceae bacterium DSM 111020]